MNLKTLFPYLFGTILGSKYLVGFGPQINIKILPAGNVITEFKSEFKSAGINQTLHRLYLEVVCNVNVITPYDSIGASITNQVLMCESVVVGQIPGTYYEFNNADEKQAFEIIE